MRVLNFIVDGQTIRRDPNCDFSGLVPGTAGYLTARFTFSPEWSGYTKVAAFYSSMGIEYPPQWLKDGETCLIPAEATAKRSFQVKIFGKNGNSELTTNKLLVTQNGG